MRTEKTKTIYRLFNTRNNRYATTGRDAFAFNDEKYSLWGTVGKQFNSKRGIVGALQSLVRSGGFRRWKRNPEFTGDYGTTKPYLEEFVAPQDHPLEDLEVVVFEIREVQRVSAREFLGEVAEQ